MLLYHYTSAENYEKIKNEGLIPYLIKKPELEPFFKEGIRGVWLWTKDLTGDEHIGSILWQLMTKATTKVVKLKIDCNATDLLRVNGLEVEITHDGRLGQWDYHRNVAAVVMPNTIHPSHIEFVEMYDLTERLR